MKILEKMAIATIVFLLIYAFISMGLRLLELTSVYASHMIGGVVATVVGLGLLMYLITKKN